MTAVLAQASCMQRYSLLFSMLGIASHDGASGWLRKGSIPMTLGLAWLLHAALVRHLGADSYVPLLPLLVLCLLAAGWLVLFGRRAVQHNRPSYAKLVPQLRQRLVFGVVIAVMLGALVIATAVALGLGAPYFGSALVLAGLLLTVLLLAQRWPKAAVFLPMVLIGYAVMRIRLNGVQQDMVWLPASQPGWVLLGLAINAAMLAWTVRMVLPMAGDAHIGWSRGVQQTWQALHDGRSPVVRSEFDWIRNKLGVGYDAALRRDSRRITAAGQDAMQLHALGDTARLALGLTPVLVPLTIILVLACLGSMQHAGVRDFVASPVWLLGFVLPVVVYPLTLLAAVAGTTPEQGLYRLTAAAPPIPRLNGRLARALLRRFLLVWLVSLIGLTIHGYLTTGSWRALGLHIAYGMSALPFAGVLLRDHGPTASTSLMRRHPALLLAYIAGLAALQLGMLWLHVHQPAFNWWWAASAMALGSVALLRLRWLRMMTCAPALPAGYLQR